MNKQQKIIISIVGITIVLLALLGLTYAYYLTRIEGNTNTNSISITTAKLELVYGDNSAEIIQGSGALEPDSENPIGTKTFTVTNNGNDSSYVVIIDNVSVTKAGDGSSTNFVSNDFRYTLSCTKSDGTKCNEVNDLTIFPIRGGILLSNDIIEDDVHTYTLTMWYIDTGVDQSEDMGKSLQARVNIADINQLENPFKTGVTATDNASLAYNIINNAKLNKNGTRLLNFPETKVAEEIISVKGTGNFEEIELDMKGKQWYYGSTYKDSQPWNGGYNNGYVSECSNTIVNKYISYPTERESWYVKSCKSQYVAIVEVEEMDYESSIQPTQDDFGTSYYYRGNVSDNYVNFAGMCWRIVRIDGNNNIKLILEDQYTTCDDNTISDSDTIKYTGAWDIEASDGTTITMNGSNPYRTGNFGYFEYATEKYKIAYLTPINESNKSMVNAFKYFQTNTLSNKISATYGGKTISDFLVSGNWCLNNRAYSDKIGTTLLENLDYSSTFYYDSYVRLYAKTTKEPTLKCPVEPLYKFDDNQDGIISSNETDMYVGTLTADEVVYAGGKVGTLNPKYYLINNWQARNSKYFWILSPYYLSVNSDYVFYIYNNGALSSNFLTNFLSFRPAINIKSGTVIVRGDGSQSNPYVIG